MSIPLGIPPIVAVLIPLAGGFITPGIGLLANRIHRPRIQDFLVLVVTLATSLVVVDIALSTWGTIHVYPLGGWLPPLGIPLVIDGLGLLVAFAASGASMLVVMYSLKFMKGKPQLSNFYTLVLFVLAGMLGVAFTGDIFNLYVFFEIMSIASYALIAFTGTKMSLEGSIKYLILGTLGTSFILLSIVLMYATTGTLTIADIASKLAVINSGGPTLISNLALGFLLVGFGMKVGMIPFHAWLPDAYQSAPLPVTTLMASGTAIVGVGGLVRVSYLIFTLDMVGPLLSGFGVVSMVIGALLALYQTDLKRLLAYSGISQMGYILVGLGMGTSLGITGGLFHMLNKALFKSLLFLAVGVIIYKTGTSDMKKLGGLAAKMPFTTGLFSIGALALIGIPPLNGFVSKASIIYSGMQSGQIVLSIIAALAAAFTTGYILRAFISVFLGEESERTKNISSEPWSLLAPMVLLAGMCVLLGVIPRLGFDLVEPAQHILQDKLIYIEAVLSELPIP